jgi:hypothetical protein
MSRLRETLSLVLITLLPFHALLVTVGTRIIKGPGHAPWALLAIWKEALLVVILVIACYEFFITYNKAKKTARREMLQLDSLDVVILMIAGLALLVSFLAKIPLGSIALGLRYDVLPLGAFLVLRRVPWSHAFAKNIAVAILLFGSIVSFMGLIGLLLPLSFYTAIGYSDMHSLYIANGPLAPFQQLGAGFLRRAQGPMSGPNQLGLWLLLPWSFAILEFFRSLRARSKERIPALILTLIIGGAIVASLSRSAWIAAIFIAALALVLIFPRRTVKHVFLGAGTVIGLSLVALVVLSPQILLRATSNEGHITRPLQAWESMWKHPWGQGLGTAGPASNRTSDTCIDLPKGSDTSWAAPHKDLCVFVGNAQVQPSDRLCHCPFLPENWYLQFGVELGVTGFVLSLLLPVLVLMMLWMQRKQLPGGIAHLAASSGLAFVGVSLAALLLHAWEDTAVAFTLWVLLAVVLQKQKDR